MKRAYWNCRTQCVNSLSSSAFVASAGALGAGAGALGAGTGTGASSSDWQLSVSVPGFPRSVMLAPT